MLGIFCITAVTVFRVGGLYGIQFHYGRKNGVEKGRCPSPVGRKGGNGVVENLLPILLMYCITLAGNSQENAGGCFLCEKILKKILWAKDNMNQNS